MAGLFDYGNHRRGQDLTGAPLAVIDVETTGLTPNQHRVIEVAIARVEGGSVVDEWSSLIDAGCDPGPTFIHRITADHLEGAPTLRDVVGDVLARLDGAVVVAHNASFEEGFLEAELRRLSLKVPTLPALCTLSLARQLLDAPNHRLQTCCSVSGVELADAHTALGDVRATAALVTCLLERGPEMRWRTDLPRLPAVPVTARPRTRASQLRRGEAGWMASLLSKLPVSTSDADAGMAEAYLSAAEVALEDGKLTGDEARMLARLAGEAGLGAIQVGELNRRLLDGLRDAALEDDVLTTTELTQLNKASALLAVPDYFSDLVATVDDSAPRPRRRNAAKGRIWLHPDLRSEAEQRVVAAGFSIGKNITRTLVAAVVPSGFDASHPRVAKACELGVRVVTVEQLDALLGESPDPAPAAPPPYRGPTPPRTAWSSEAPGEPVTSEAKPEPVSPEPQPAGPVAGWYGDPTGRYEHRYWDGATWTEHVVTGGQAAVDPPF